MNKAPLFLLILETLAFIVSIIYYSRNKGKYTFYLTCFFGFTILVEIIGSYTILMDKYELFSSLRGTPWEKNIWLYNIQLLISAVFYVSYFKWQLSSKVFRKILNILLLMFSVGAISYLTFGGVYFTRFSPFTLMFGTILIILSIALYYIELLKSDLILNVTRSLPFYISIGALIFHLCTPPLFLYSLYFSDSINPEFAYTYKLIIFGSNFIMYTVYILGFIICARKKKMY